MKKIFENFCKNIEIEEKEVKKIAIIKNEIEECIYNYYKTPSVLENVKYIGAYGRNTAVFIDNIRVLCVLPSYLYLEINLDIKDILDNMISALRSRFITCERNPNEDGLIVNINDTLSFKIIPGFAFENGEYIFLNNNKWRELHLKAENDMINNLNIRHNNNVIQLCRILKIWKHYHDLDISNILLDTFVYHFFNLSVNKKYCFDNYDEMILDFFKFLLPNCKSNNYISFDSKTVLTRKVDLYDTVFKCMITSETAINLSKYKIDNEFFFNDWKEIFGSLYF